MSGFGRRKLLFLLTNVGHRPSHGVDPAPNDRILSMSIQSVFTLLNTSAVELRIELAVPVFSSASR